jgi:hypothetical protein
MHKARLTVHILAWWQEHNVLMSVDASNSIFAWRLKLSTVGWIADTELFHGKLDCGRSIVQLFVIQVPKKFILSTREADYLWNLDGEQEKSRPCISGPGIRRWIQHPLSASHIICVEGATARIHNYSTWEETAMVSTGNDMRNFQLKSIFPFLEGHQLLIEVSEKDGAQSTSGIHFLDSSIFRLNDNAVAKSKDTDAASPAGQIPPVTAPNLPCSALARHVSHIIGICDNSKIVFLDANSWICSVELKGQAPSSYFRHFYVPYDWFSGSKNVICAVTSSGIGRDKGQKVLLARHEELAIIKGGFEYAEEISL